MRSATPDFRHLTLWPASGARYGDGSLAPPAPRRASPEDLPPSRSDPASGTPRSDNERLA
ncbi:hypothetical protein [Vannielia sp.]|uniref:hypothetical protein n=1 Tax=Vannielia sp. TaxID=2813045 RepID=UPI0026205A05|nr:hypothetical protein [Vannielia sp.]MDF1873968.1 hypothetical protein [Vannielia sp.]